MWKTSCLSRRPPLRQQLRGHAASGAFRSEDNSNETLNTRRGAKAHRQAAHVCGSNNTRQPGRSVPPQHGRRLVAPHLEQHSPGLAAPRGHRRDPPLQTAEDAPVSKPEMNLDVDAPDKVAGVLTAAATSYQASAVELSAAWQDRQIPMIWAAIASELDIAAWKIEKLVKQRVDPNPSPIRRKA